MDARASVNQSGTCRQRVKLLGLCGLILLAGVGLVVIAGAPRLPTMPSRETLAGFLEGSTIPLDGAQVVLVDLAWIVWAWIALSLALELACVGAELIANGSAWVGSLRSVADRLTPPLVRRGVAAAFAVQVISRGVPIAAAQSLPPVETVTELGPTDADSTNENISPEPTATPTYVVRPGDTLWSIAERAYGSGQEYRRLVDANIGRSMTDGEVFSAKGVIKPGWQLVAPEATWGVEDEQGDRFYEVRPGDTLSSIAGVVLGDDSRWTELFDLNRGTRATDGVHVLGDANTIWPGLRLRLPPDDFTADTATDGTPSIAEPVQEQPDPAPIELLAAAAPTQGPVAQLLDATQLERASPAPTPPPLVRTPHEFQPVVLDPADASPVPPRDSDASDGPEASAQSIPRSVPQVPVEPLVLGGIGLAGLAGLAIGVRRRRLRPLPQAPESEVVVQGGFAEAQPAHDLTRGLHGVGSDPVVVLVSQVERLLADYNFEGVGVVAVRHGRSSTTITLRCGLADQSMLLDLAPAFADSLEAETEACVSTDQDILLRLVRLRKTRMLPIDTTDERTCLVPVGLLYDRQVYYATWQALGHVLVVSLPGHGSDTILTSLVATLTSRRSPDRLRVWMLASPRSLPAPLFDLPHLVRVLDPADHATVATAVADLRAEVDERARHRSDAGLLVVVPELATLAESAASLALVAERAAECGVRLVIGTSDPEHAAASPLIPHIPTRMVLRMLSEEISVALLGVADAAFLGGGGRLLLRLDGREPVELYGYQVANEHLERLVKVMRSGYPAPDVPAPPPDVQQGVASGTDRAGTSPPAVDANAETEPIGADGDLAACGDSQTGRAATQEVAPPLRITCFGTPRVTCCGQVVWPRSRGDAKPWEMLLYLACQPAEGVSRAAVVDVLWPEDELEDDGGHRFRQLRYRLRRQLASVPGAPEGDGVCLDRRQLRLDPGLICSDAQEFLEHVRNARVNPGPDTIDRLERARALYVGDLLEGPDVRRYAWIDERDDSGVTLREHFRRLFQNASVRLAELYTAVGALDSAIAVYRELTQLDPADDSLWQALFRLHAKRGDRESLLAEEQRLRRTLRDLAEELDEPPSAHMDEPSRETVEEFHRLLSGLRDREPAAV